MLESISIRYECPKCNGEVKCRYGITNIYVSEISTQLESKLCPTCRGGMLQPAHIKCVLGEPDDIEKESVFFRWTCMKCGGQWHSKQSFHPRAISECAKIMKTLADLEQITCPYGCKGIPNLVSFLCRGEQQYVD